MFKKVLITIAVVFFSISAVHASVGKSIESHVSGFSWYEELKEYGSKVHGTSAYSLMNYSLRYKLAQYLENVGLYDAGDTIYCDDDNDEFHNEKRDSCFIGTKEQNLALLKAIKSPKVQNHLSEVSAYDIVNGKNEVFLTEVQMLAARYCSELYKSSLNDGNCERWKEQVALMEKISH